MTYIIGDEHTDDKGRPCRWTFGTAGVHGRFGGAHTDSTGAYVNLYRWDEGTGLGLRHTEVRCRSFRQAVRVLRQHLRGH